MTPQFYLAFSLLGGASALLVVIAGLYAVMKQYRVETDRIDRLMTLLDIEDMAREKISLFAPRIRRQTRREMRRM